jgi:folate-dependent phosphoribosylglycinamide formyltransferase PurN
MSGRIAVAVSGGGRSLANFLEHQAPESGYEVVAVIASRPDCRAVTIAREAGLALFVDDFAPARLADVGERLYPWLAAQRVELVALAGFLKLFPLAPGWEKRIINIHPALLPKHGGRGMYGDRVHAAVLAARETQSGPTVHYVNERYDEGAIIEQAVVPVLPGDTAHTLADRVFAAECELYPRVVARLLSSPPENRP